MARVPTAPRSSRRSYDRDRRDVRAELERLDRRRFEPPQPIPLAKVTPVKVDRWPTGTAWLNTSVPAP